MFGKTNLLVSTSHSHHHQHQFFKTVQFRNCCIWIFFQPVAAIKIEDSHKKVHTSQEPSAGSRLEIPAFKDVGRLDPLRSTPRLNDEICTDEAYLKRHEKYEKQEKSIKRRDRIWQREEQYRLHLMKISKDEGPSPPKLLSIEIVPRMPKTRRHH
ncbi:unnamed protein product [Toxocara canis]|uniref:PEHE domain-containing protein n=1 Tax=Toxocara canis TaxID=6265 RepID=A0A183UQD2_TOXCA|nr:unnamed protein product [Toxocara canis]